MTFNYRGNPLVQQARQAIARGDIGTPHFLHGHYLQDWLLKDTDYSWRLDPDKGGASSALGDIGSHWCDLAQHVTGLRITHVLGDITTVVPKRKKPRGVARGVSGGGDGDGELVDIKVEDLASVLVRFDNGAQRQLLGRARSARGHKNDLVLEVCGAKASLRLAAGAAERALDRPSRSSQRDAAEGSVAPRRTRARHTRTCPAAIRRRGPTPSAT